ncbi:MAG: S-methyl-5-thioribose-1-phosphate isomerase, partial [Actinomycetes bacterium]
MTVRGAPAIGVTAAGGLALAAAEAAASSDDPAALQAALEQAASGLLGTRPTAVNLSWAIGEMRAGWEAALGAGGPQAEPAALAASLLARAQAIHDDDVDRCLRIGEHGAGLFKAGDRILTHCNAGALATAGYGTALGVVRSAQARHGGISVWVDETRPWLQGARLTAWELQVEGIPYRLISDNMAGYFMRRGEVDGVVVGADRIAACGDTANKIGTYTVSVLAKEHAVPFYVAAPLSTVDLTVASGDDIPIEERDPAEVTSFRGAQIAPQGAVARHPAFDVTPAANIAAIVTEAGVLRPPYSQSLAAACAGGRREP